MNADGIYLTKIGPIAKTHGLEWSVTDYLLMTMAVSALVWYLQWLWGRRKLYTYAMNVHGPISLPIIGCGYLFLGSPYETFKNVQYLLNKYPYIAKVWFGHRLFFGVQDPKHLDILLNSPKALAKEMLYKHAERAVGHGLFTAPVKVWKKNRKLISPTFNQRILDQFVEVFAEQGEILNQQLVKQCDKEIDLFHFMTKATLDIICETAMGVKVHAQTSDSLFGKWADRVMEIVFLRIFVIWYHSDFLFSLSPLKKEFDEILAKMHDFTRKVVVQKRVAFEKKMKESQFEAQIEETTKRKAFLDYLIELTYTKDGSIFTDDELRQEVDTFMIAGSDTTATSNCFTLMLLGMYPSIQQKVYEEVIDVLGHERLVTHTDLPKLKYTEAVLKETLRLFPVGPFIVRAVDEDLDLGDVVLPAGCSAVLGIINVQRNPQYWKDPLKFDPERFLPPRSDGIQPGSYIPFSWGPRNCIGPKYAMMAMKSIITAVIRNYTVSCGYKTIEEIELKTNLVVRPTYGFKVTFHKRKTDQ